MHFVLSQNQGKFRYKFNISSQEIAERYLKYHKNDVSKATHDYLTNPSKYQLDEILFYIFSFLSFDEVLKSKYKLVSSYFFEVLDDDKYYENFLKSTINPRIPLKKQVIQRVLLEKNLKLIINQIDPIKTENLLEIGSIQLDDNINFINHHVEYSTIYKKRFSKCIVDFKIK